MTEEEFYNLYNKISDTIDGFKDYHYYYYCCNETYNGTSMTLKFIFIVIKVKDMTVQKIGVQMNVEEYIPKMTFMKVMRNF